MTTAKPPTGGFKKANVVESKRSKEAPKLGRAASFAPQSQPKKRRASLDSEQQAI